MAWVWRLHNYIFEHYGSAINYHDVLRTEILRIMTSRDVIVDLRGDTGNKLACVKKNDCLTRMVTKQWIKKYFAPNRMVTT